MKFNILLLAMLCAGPGPNIRAADKKEIEPLGSIYVKEAIGALKDRNPYVRIRGSLAIGSAPFDVRPFTAELVPALVSALDDVEDTVRRNACWSLERFGSAARAAVPKLIKLSEDPNVAVRVNALTLIAAIGADAKDAIPVLAAVMKEDKEVDARAQAANALHYLGKDAEAAIPALIVALKDPAPEVRGAALRTLAYLRVPSVDVQSAVFARFQDDAASVRKMAIEAAEMLQGDAKALVEALRGPIADSNRRVRETAANSLKNQGKLAVPLLMEMLDHRTADVRGSAAWALGFLGGEARDAVGKLMRLARDDADAPVRARALAALGAIGDAREAAIAAVKEALKDPDKHVRARAQEALDLIESSKKVPEEKK